MTITVSVGSGKGGTGKSMILADLAVSFARMGKKVCIVDLDIGGANAHIFFGLFDPQLTLTDFLTRKVNSLNKLMYTCDAFYGLNIIPGTGNTLHTANMNYQEKQRLLRAISAIDADIVFMDVGGGTSYHTLDFFMAADLQIGVTTQEPTSVMDFYTFIQLATIRTALSSFLSHSKISNSLKKQTFHTITDVFNMAESIQQGAREKIQEQLKSFHPLLIINRVTPGSKLNTLKLKKLASKYLGIYLPELGEVPEDAKVPESVQAYLPISEYAMHSKASTALAAITDKLRKVIELFDR